MDREQSRPQIFPNRCPTGPKFLRNRGYEIACPPSLPPLLRKSGKLTNTSFSLPPLETEAMAWAGNAEPQYHDLKALLENFVARNESDLHIASDTDSKPEAPLSTDCSKRTTLASHLDPCLSSGQSRKHSLQNESCKPSLGS